MANQGFVRTLNLSEIELGAQTIQNLAGGTVDADLRVFAGLSSQKSQLIWNRFVNTAEINQSVSSLKEGTQLQWDTNYTYTDDDYIFIEPVNILRDFNVTYIGFADGGNLISDPLGSLEFNYDIGEGYEPDEYKDVQLLGGSGNGGARADIVVGSGGTVESVRITEIGNNYNYGDKLLVGSALGPDGVGFVIRITAFPWEATAVGNHAWDIEDLDLKDLRVTFDNGSPTLDGTYTIEKGASNRNIWGVPNNATTLSYDVNRQISVQEKIDNNFDIYDINGDGKVDQDDKTYIEMYINGDDEAAFINFVQTNGVAAGSIRTSGAAIYRYIDGLAPSVLDLDGTGIANAVDVSLFNQYATSNEDPDGIPNSGDEFKAIYVRKDAASLQTGRQSYSASLKHAISVTCKLPTNPGAKEFLGIDDIYNRPYFYIEKYENNEWKNIYDNFDKYGTTQTCTTDYDSYLKTSIGELKAEGNIQYRIVDKFSTFDGTNTVYYVRIVASGTGFTTGLTFGSEPTLTASTGTPVFNKNSEYGVFDSDGASKFYLRTNPRSSIESIKQMVLFATSYNLSTDESSLYGNSQVPTLTLIPDLILKRDDSLTLTNIQNLEIPEIIDDGENKYSPGIGGFSYGSVSADGYSATLSKVTDNVDESIYLRGTKYRIDRSLYYMKEIKFNGFITSYDPDELNLTQTDLVTDLSPGIYISSSLSQITNPLASDFANKTRSFSSDFNPWQAQPDANKLLTLSENVTINDLVWTSRIEFDIGVYPPKLDDEVTDHPKAGQKRFVNGDTNENETLADNFSIPENEGDPVTSYKLKISINGEVFYLMMSKA